MNKNKKLYLQTAVVLALVAVFVVIFMVSSDNSSDVITVDEKGERAGTLSEQEKDEVTIPDLENDLEIGTDGVVSEIERAEADSDELTIITLITEVNTLYTVAVPAGGSSVCEAGDAIAEISVIEPGDKIGVRGKTDAEGRIVPCESEFHSLRIHGVYENDEVGLTFSYRKSPAGYRLITDGYDFSADPQFITGALLMYEDDAKGVSFDSPDIILPPSTALRVYHNPEGLSADAWAQANAEETNYEQALADPAEITVGQRAAIGYTVRGVYFTDTYVVAYGEYVLLVSGEYIEYESEAFHDIERLVRTIEFIY